MAVAAAASALVACGTAATIQHTDGRRTEGQIVAGDAESVYVRTLRGMHEIPRSEITEINHPGGALETVGVCLSLVGLAQLSVGTVMMLSANAEASQDIPLALMIEGGIVTAVGLVMWVDGNDTYSQSVEALRKPPPPFANLEESAGDPRYEVGRARAEAVEPVSTP